MKIALDATPLTEPTGGIARYTWQLTCALARLVQAEAPAAEIRDFRRRATARTLHEIWLLSDQPFAIPVAGRGTEDSGQGNALPRGVQLGARPQTVFDKRWWLWGLNREMGRHGIDLFHGTDFAVPYRKRRASVMTIHDLSPWVGSKSADSSGGDEPWQPSANRIRRRTPRMLERDLATMVITPTEAIRRAVIGRFGLADDRVVAVPLAAGPEFCPAKNPQQPASIGRNPYFLFVGTLEARKNVLRVIDAWREVRKTHTIDLVLVGRARPDFVLPAAQAGLHLLGSAPDADLPALYSGAAAVVYPSLYEGFGLPVLEAMQCGALVITSEDPAIGEVCGSGENAIQVSAYDTGALAAAMRAVAARPVDFQSMRERALQRAAQFSWDRTARQTLAVYERALAIERAGAGG